MANPIIYGASYSTYVRTTRLTLEEKGAPYELVEVDMLKGAHKQPEHLKRHPFGFIPAFAHDGLTLYETGAVIRYIDRVLPGPALQPKDAKALACMDQIIGIIDSYAYGALIAKIVMQRVVTPMLGGTPDETVIESGLERARISLGEFERMMGSSRFLAGDGLSLADLHFAPIFAYFRMTPEAERLLAPHRGLRDWWSRLETRPSLMKTQPKFG
jgi:glutathione S-transferase